MDDVSSPTVSSATFTNNSINGVSVDGNTISASTVWNNTSVVYYLPQGLTVASGATLTIDAGQVVKFGLGYQSLTVDGTLAADGTATQPVVFTSFRDDSAGGDTNNDGSATSPMPGNWNELQFTNTSAADVLANVVVNYGHDSYGEVEADDTSPTISNSTFSNSSTAGIRLVGSSRAF